MTQIQKVEKVLCDPAEKTVYGNRLPQISSKATDQQLQNAYKQIKTYEYEINKLRGTSKEGSYVEQYLKKYPQSQEVRNPTKVERGNERQAQKTAQ